MLLSEGRSRAMEPAPDSPGSAAGASAPDDAGEESFELTYAFSHRPAIKSPGRSRSPARDGAGYRHGSQEPLHVRRIDAVSLTMVWPLRATRSA